MLLEYHNSFRSTTYADIDTLLVIFAHARQQMAADGNPTQWGDGYPGRQQLEEDTPSKTLA